MSVVSDYYTRSQGYRDAHRHGSLGHPQDLSILNPGHYDRDRTSRRAAVKRKNWPQKDAREVNDMEPEEVEARSVNEHVGKTAKFFLVNHFQNGVDIVLS